MIIPKDPTNWTYPAIEPYRTGMLKVSPLHELYYEESGNPKGKPVVFLHGGPGGGSDPKQRRYFHPEKYRIILFDQRGCGKSSPRGSLEQNTTWDLVEDIEKLRKYLQIERWQVFGGSWGSTLALAYCETHPDRVTEIVLRGIFLLRQSEVDWFYQAGAHNIYPDAWEIYTKPIPAAEQKDFVSAYYKRLTSTDEKVRREAAKAWSVWEGATSRLFQDPDFIERFGKDEFAEVFARIECHYFINKGFMKTDGELLANVGKIRHIPAVIIQGRYDIVCPFINAWDLHKAWPEAEFMPIPDAVHTLFEPGTSKAAIAATDRFVENWK